MAIHWPIESEYGRELARWNTPRNRVVHDSNGEPVKDPAGGFVRGMNAVGYEEYPKMLYKAQRLPNGQPSAGEVPPHPAYCSREEFEARSAYIDEFNRSCRRIVNDEAEERVAVGQGWTRTTKEALDLYEQEQQAIAQAAAQAEFYVQRMSAKAQREWQELNEEAGAEHVVDIQPAKRRPGRPRKAVPVAPMAGTPPRGAA